MSRLLALALVLAMASVARAQEDPAAPGSFLMRSQRLSVKSGGKLDVRLPAAASFARPVVLVCHGMAASPRDFEALGEHLASRGFAAALFEQPHSWSSNTQSWADYLRGAIDELERANADSKSGLMGELDLSKLAVMGHSFGGAAVVVAASEDARIKSVVAFAPVNQKNRVLVLKRAKELTVPLLVIAAQGDWLANNEKYTRPIYENASAAPARLYLEFKGADHNFYQDRGKGKRPHETSEGYTTAWLERWLLNKGERAAWVDGSRAKRDEAAGIFRRTRAASLTRGILGTL